MMDDALVPQEQKALTPAETEKVEEIRKRIDLSDPNAVTQYGAAVQGRIAGFSDTILAEVKGFGMQTLYFLDRELPSGH